MDSHFLRPSDLASPVSCAALRALADDLSRLIAPNEAAFMQLGDALASARSQLAASDTRFRELSATFDQADGGRTVEILSGAREEILRISGETRDIFASMKALERSTAGIARPVAALSKIIGEIAALATNAKVQAAQVQAAGVDFSVFTKDIDRLRVLAGEAVKRASGRLTALALIVASAGLASDAFQRGDAAELEAIGTRMKGRLEELQRRRDQAHASIRDFESRTATIAARVSRCIGALQINDLTSQRIEHVRTALNLLSAMIDPDAVIESECGWLRELDDQRKRLLLAAVCDLQASQLGRAMADFSAETGELSANLAALASDASAIQVEAQRVFGGASGETSFIHAVSSDVERATGLLENYCRADEHIRQLIADVSDGFAAMTEDLSAIHSIDADMRIMGLNATFKCTRLGPAGVALGVVAQELRACSRRTEDTSRAISIAIEGASSGAAALAERSAREHDAADALTRDMAASTRSLGDFSEVLRKALTDLSGACLQVSVMLEGASKKAVVDQRLQQGSDDIVRRLRQIGAQAAPGQVDPLLIRDDVQRMLGQHYTMASERLIHDLFADEDISTPSPPAKDTPEGDGVDIDDFFF